MLILCNKEETLWQTVSSWCSNSPILITMACKRASCSINQHWLTHCLDNSWTSCPQSGPGGGEDHLKNAHAALPVKPLSAYSLNKYGLGKANLLVQVHTVLEQPCIPSSHILDCSILTWRPVEVPMGPIVDLSLYVSTEGLVFHAGKIVEDVWRHNHTKELEVGKVKTVTKLGVGCLWPLCTGLGGIEDRFLFRIVHGVEESQVGMTVFHQVTTWDSLEGVLDEHHRLTTNARGFRRRRHWGDSRALSLLKQLPSTDPLISPVPSSSWISPVALIIPISDQPPFPWFSTPMLAHYAFVTVITLPFMNKSSLLTLPTRPLFCGPLTHPRLVIALPDS